MNKIQIQTKSNLTIYFYLTHVKREEIGTLIQFLQKFNLNFRRIKTEKQTRASNFLRKNSNFMAQSSKPITFEEFRMISKFLNTQAIAVGFEYGNTIWDVSRTKMQFLTNPTDSTWELFNRILF